jgi:uncharacterized membrane protein
MLPIALILLASIAGFADPASAVPPRYRVTVIAASPAEPGPTAIAINNRGDAVVVDPSKGGIGHRVWRNGKLHELPEGFVPSGINDRGVVAGWVIVVGLIGVTGSSGELPTPTRTATSKAAMWNGGTVTELALRLPSGEARPSMARGINNSGRLVGSLGPRSLAFAGKGTPLATPGGYVASEGSAINRSGTVVGWVQTQSGPGVESRRLAAVWSGSRLQVIQPLEGYDTSRALGVGSDDTVVGDMLSFASGQRTAFRWARGVATPLPAPADTPEHLKHAGTALGIHSSGRLVVGSLNFDVALIWEGDTAYRLTDLIDPVDPVFGRAVIRDAVAINDKGQIAGRAHLDGKWVAVILTPSDIGRVPNSPSTRTR